MRKIYILILFFVIPTDLWASDKDFSYELISFSQGLPNSQINFIYQGNKGVMWIGTSNGLCMYDGYTFSVLQSVPFDSTTFADDNIIAIAQDKNNNIWLHTHYGIEFFNIYTGAIKRVRYIKNENLDLKLLPSKTEDLIYLLYDNNIEKISLQTFESDVVSTYPNYKILDAELYNNQLILLTNNGILHYNVEKASVSDHYYFNGVQTGEIILSPGSYFFTYNNQIYYYDTINRKPLNIYSNNNTIHSLSRNCLNNLVFADKEKVVRIVFDKEFQAKSKNVFLNDKEFDINGLMQDNNCLIWVATDKGIVKINPYSERIHHVSSNNWGLESITPIVESSKNGVIYRNKKNENVFYHSHKDTDIR